MKRRVRKGIPPCMRVEVWPIICNFKALKNEYHFFYDELLQKETVMHQHEIHKDVDRTYQNNIHYLRGAGKVTAE